MILRNQYNRLSGMASKSGIIVLFLLAHLVLLLMMVFSFPRINAKIGSQAFDLKTFGYSHEEATSMIQNLDQATVDLYIFPQLFLLDILYPVLLALFLSTFIIRLSNLVWKSPDHVSSNLFILPFIAMFFDYLENILIAVMITNTSVSSSVIRVASFFTQMKGAFTTISWIIILLLVVFWLKNMRTNRNVLSTKHTLK